MNCNDIICEQIFIFITFGASLLGESCIFDPPPPPPKKKNPGLAHVFAQVNTNSCSMDKLCVVLHTST